MTLMLTLPPELESQLRQRATAAGKDLAALVREAVEEKLARDAAPPAHPDPINTGNLPYIEWRKRFDSWMGEVAARASRYPEGFVVDDGREGIYEGRGE
jgi:hypothetical protein